MTFGYSADPGSCNHAGTWSTDSVAGYGILYCSGCGKSFYLWQRDSDGTLIWMPMERMSEEEAERVLELEQAVRPVQDDEDERPVLPESGEEGREGPSLQSVPIYVGSSAPTSTSETNL